MGTQIHSEQNRNLFPISKATSHLTLSHLLFIYLSVYLLTILLLYIIWIESIKTRIGQQYYYKEEKKIVESKHTDTLSDIRLLEISK